MDLGEKNPKNICETKKMGSSTWSSAFSEIILIKSI